MTTPNMAVPALGPALTPPTDNTDETWAAITLTPEDAHAILTHRSYLDEHDIDFLHVGMLADKMQAGEWLPLSQITFVISATGEPQLVDGHHRLHAVIVAGFTDKWIVCSFWNQRYSGSDMHKKLNSVREPRGDADIGRVLYYDQLTEQMQSIIITAARYLNHWNSQYQLPELCHTPPQRDNIARARERLDAFREVDLVIQEKGVASHIRTWLATPTVVAIMAETTAGEPGDAASFWRAVATNGNGIAGELRDRLIEQPPREAGNYYRARLAAQAWNQRKSPGRLRAEYRRPIRLEGTSLVIPV